MVFILSVFTCSRSACSVGLMFATNTPAASAPQFSFDRGPCGQSDHFARHFDGLGRCPARETLEVIPTKLLVSYVYLWSRSGDIAPNGRTRQRAPAVTASSCDVAEQARLAKMLELHRPLRQGGDMDVIANVYCRRLPSPSLPSHVATQDQYWRQSCGAEVSLTKPFSYVAKVAATVAAAVLQAACGGGDTGTASPTATPSSITLAPACSGTHCSARGTTYSGAGVGVWQATNRGGAAGAVSVSIDGLTGQTVTLIYTNQGEAAQPLSANSQNTLGATGARIQEASASGTLDAIFAAFDLMIFNFNAHALDGYTSGPASTKQQAASNDTVLRPRSATGVGAQRTWNHQQPDGKAVVISATLRRQATATDGRIVNLWVQDSEYGTSKISDGIINTLSTKFASGNQSIYTLAKSLIGQPWGEYSSSASLIGPDQSLDIVVLNIQPDGQPYGRVGYFWARNNFTTGAQPLSNQSLSLYMDSETVYLGGTEGMNMILSTLGHEFTHMANFYQRGVLHGSQHMYDGMWLEEMTAMTMEDVLSGQVNPSYDNVRDSRFPAWLQSAYDCALTAFDPSPSSPCPGYPISGSLGGFLLRQYGVSYYKNLLQNFSSTDSVEVLTNALQANGGERLGDAVARWGTAIALLPASSSPSGFAYPARTDGGFAIPGVDGPNYAGQRRLPSSVPSTLQGFGQFPVSRGMKIGTYSETLTVPANSVVSIVVQ